MELFHVFFLFLVAELRRISFCFVCRFDLLSFWIPSIFLTPTSALCKYSSASSSSSSLPACLTALPAFQLSLSHSRSLLFSLLRTLSVTAKSKQRKAHVVSCRQRRRRLRRKTSKTFLFSFGAFQIIFD